MILNKPQDSNSDEETKPFDAEESVIDSSSNETVYEDYPSGHTSHLSTLLLLLYEPGGQGRGCAHAVFFPGWTTARTNPGVQRH